MNLVKLASDEQVKLAPAPPVETMYFLPALTKLCTLAPANEEAETPLQFSLPQLPVAKAQVTACNFDGMALSRFSVVPVTAVVNCVVL